MATDNVQLARLQTAVKELNVTDTEAEDFTGLLPPAGVNYVRRRIKNENRPRICVFYNCLNRPLKHALAFGFRRFIPVCLHSLGPFSGRSRKSMILYHEFGHLFFHQPRGGFLALIFGSAIPLLWLVYNDPSRPDAALVALIAICILEFLAIAFLNEFHREIFADGFALASKFTEAWDELSEAQVREVETRGYLFEEKPGSIRAYENTIKARGWARAFLFRHAYRRTNAFGWLNATYLKYDRMSSGKDFYWKEMFYRRALVGVLFSVRVPLSAVKLIFVFVLLSQLSGVHLAGGLIWILLGCSIAVLVTLAISATMLDETSSMVAQAHLKGATSLIVVDDAVAENARREGERKEREDVLRSMGLDI
ncbi:hypothetical protein [Neorhizobium petrolearium]|uniref:hypothetical protein n=1 Tax=Neorhizobium petrolearium TaxID=515361 RepID=UPI003F5CDFB4